MRLVLRDLYHGGIHRTVTEGVMFDRLIHPPMTPEQFQEPRWARFLFTGTTAAWLWLVVRLYMAYVYLPAGWGKITSGKWLFGDGSPIQGLVSGAISSEDTPAWYDWV
jgi:hypothetical protein